MTDKKSTPAVTLTDGRMKATVWKNEGSNGPFYSVQFTRTYRTEDGAYGDAHSFTGTELLKIADLANRAYQTQRELRDQARRAQNGGES